MGAEDNDVVSQSACRASTIQDEMGAEGNDVVSQPSCGASTRGTMKYNPETKRFESSGSGPILFVHDSPRRMKQQTLSDSLFNKEAVVCILAFLLFVGYWAGGYISWLITQLGWKQVTDIGNISYCYIVFVNFLI